MAIEHASDDNKALARSIVQREKMAVANQSNSFVRYACYELTVMQMRLWLACLRKIPSDATELQPLHFTTSELAKMCGFSSDGGRTSWYIYDAINEMKDISVDMRFEHKDGGSGITHMHPFFSNVFFDDTYHDYSGSEQDLGKQLKNKEFISSEDAKKLLESKGHKDKTSSAYGASRHVGESLKGKQYVTIILSPYMETELLNLTKDFTQLSLFYLLPMKSRYSLRLYQDLRSYLYLTYTDEGPKPYTLYMSIDDMQRQFTNPGSKPSTTLKTWASIKLNVLSPALEEINKYTDMCINEDDFVIVERTGKKNKDGVAPKTAQPEYFQAQEPTVFEPDLLLRYPILHSYRRAGNLVKSGKRVMGVLFTIKERSAEDKNRHLDYAMSSVDTRTSAAALASATLLMGESPAEMVEGTGKLREMTLTDANVRHDSGDLLQVLFRLLYDEEYNGSFSDTFTDIILPLIGQMADNGVLTETNMSSLSALQEQGQLAAFFSSAQSELCAILNKQHPDNVEAYSIAAVKKMLQNPKLHIRASTSHGTGSFTDGRNVRVQGKASDDDWIQSSLVRGLRIKRKD